MGRVLKFVCWAGVVVVVACVQNKCWGSVGLRASGVRANPRNVVLGFA